jgi:hypothetical protein
MQIHREFAEGIVAKMRALHSKPATIVPAQASEFTHLDLGSYRHFRASLEAAGYRYLGDFEILDMMDMPDSPMMRTMLSVMLSADGVTSAGHYQVRRKFEWLTQKLVQGILNFRFLDAPASFLNGLRTEQIYDFESEAGLTHITTSSAELVGNFSSPVSIDAKLLPEGTPLQEVRRAHATRLASAVARTGAVPTRMANYEDVLAMGERLRQQKRAHRVASGWITRDELIAFTKGNTALADSIFEEVQAILHPS